MYLKDFTELSTLEQILLITNFFLVIIAICLALAAGATVPCYLRGGKVCALLRYNDYLKYNYCDCDVWIKTWNDSKKYNKDSSSAAYIRQYPIVSILTPFWRDSNELKLACSGIIISNDTALTSSFCKSYTKDLGVVKVRSNSKMWAQGGDIHNISQTKEPLPGLLTLKVKPPFRVPPIDPPPVNWTRARKVYFSSDIYRKANPALRRKYEPFNAAERWTTKYCSKSIKTTVCHSKFNNILDKFFISCNSLVGMAAFDGQKELFLDFSQPKFMKLLRQTRNNVSEHDNIQQEGNSCKFLYLDQCFDRDNEFDEC